MLTGRCSADHKRKEKEKKIQSSKTGLNQWCWWQDSDKNSSLTARNFFRYWVTLNEKLLKEYFTDNGAPNSSMLPHSSPWQCFIRKNHEVESYKVAWTSQSEGWKLIIEESSYDPAHIHLPRSHNCVGCCSSSCCWSRSCRRTRCRAHWHARRRCPRRGGRRSSSCRSHHL